MKTALRFVEPMKFVLVAMLLSLTSFADAQIHLSGKITDSATSKPVADASVYIANTTIGTKTDGNGRYHLNFNAPGNHQLLVSCVGYQTKQVDITGSSTELSVDITLKPRAIELKEVTIDASEWKRNLALFKREFIGTADVQECNILNPEILNLYFDHQANRLTVTSDDFLEIQNNILGYKLRFLVKDFYADYNTLKTHYSGSVIFEELPGKSKQLNNWAKKRSEVYNGSFRKLLVSLAKGEAYKNQFVMRRLVRTPNLQRPTDSLINSKLKDLRLARQQSGIIRIDSLTKWTKLKQMPKVNETLVDQPVYDADVAKPTGTNGMYKLQFDWVIYVVYKGKRVDKDLDDLHRYDGAKSYQIAAISLKDPTKPIIFDEKGILQSKENIFFEGAWDSRIIDMLPFDYVPVGR